MENLKLESKPVSQSTVDEIKQFVYQNKTELSIELKLFYQDVKGFIETQLTKPCDKRMNMYQILDRSYNIDTYVIKSGATELNVEFI